MRSSVVLLATALQSSFASAKNLTQAELADLEQYWSYGRSEPVYPTPEGSGLGGWAEAYAKAKSMVAQMSNDQKNNITYGYTADNGCSGNIPGVDSVSFPGLCLRDSSNGVRGAELVNGYPSGIHVGASWNRNLTYWRNHYMGAEFKAKGVNVVLGPVVGPLGRIARGGRNWEGFTNDPYLAGALVSETITGLQENTIACVKHLIGNEQELYRNPPFLIENSPNNSLSTNIDDKTMHELYLWPFQDAVKAGVGSVMCSYNRVNNSYGCQNSKVLNGLLKDELGFQGFVMTDWGAQHSGLASAEAGLDMAMADSDYWMNGNLTLAVNNGSLAQSRLDDMATRILAAWYRYSPLDNPGAGLPANLSQPHELVEARDPASKDTILQGAVEGHVLVKNVNNALPLKKPKFLSLFGYDAVAAKTNTFDAITTFGWDLGLDNTLSYINGTPVNPTWQKAVFLSSIDDPDAYGPEIALNGTLFTGQGSGITTPAYIDAPFDAFQRQAREDYTFLAWDFQSPTPLVNPASQACIVFINAQAAEGWDRAALRDDYSDGLVESVASQCNNTMVVIHNAGIRLVDQWIDHPNITAVIFAHLPGQDSGAALVEIMYGKQSPSGRLPYTVAKNESDYGSLLNPIVQSGDVNIYYPQDDFTEGVYIDYKAFIKDGIIPRYEFGYGLTYTDFAYSDISADFSPAADLSRLPPKPAAAEGGLESLWDTIAVVNCTVSNTGSVEAAEVAQLYVGIPNGPAKVLRGFSKDTIAPCGSTQVSFALNRRDLSSWDAVEQSWVLQQGTYRLYVGKSVSDIQLTAELTIC